MASRKAFNKVLVLPILLLMNCFVLPGQCARLHHTKEGEDFITATCKHTLHFEVCVSSLRSDPRSSHTSDLKKLAEIALNLSAAEAAQTLSYVYELKSSSAASGTNNSHITYMYSCLSDCVEEYSEAIESLQDSAQALADGEYDRVGTLVTAAMTDAETCEDGFKDMPRDDDSGSTSWSSPLTERNRYFSDLCSNFLAITKLVV